MSTNVSVTFTGGRGKLDAALIRNGNEIDSGSINKSGTIELAESLRGDTISINGSSAGGATVSINKTTDPPTPDIFTAGPIMSGYDILN